MCLFGKAWIGQRPSRTQARMAGERVGAGALLVATARRTAPAYRFDYFFLPAHILTRVNELAIGTYEDWCGCGLSDHVPILIDLTSTFDAARGEEQSLPLHAPRFAIGASVACFSTLAAPRRRSTVGLHGGRTCRSRGSRARGAPWYPRASPPRARRPARRPGRATTIAR
jgi:hypothetical protein